ncbi:MAG: molybdopterin-dependent oxidoreductase, partial [Desulfobacterota bacterium]|nr:molybdopterin-dependent oxidoreductase [Thermodesulfobacteriota bacterium]
MTDQRKTFSVVGKSVPRVDAAAKVRGKALFTDDMVLPGMVYAKIKPSTVAHANIKRIDTSKALARPGVVAVITGKDSPTPFSVNDHLPTECPLAVKKVCYYGEGIAAAAAVDEETAEEALDLIEVEYEPLPLLLDPLVAMGQNEVRIHDFAHENISVSGYQHFGNVDDALKNSHTVVEGTYNSSYVQNAFLEPQSALADFNPETGKLTLHTCIQLPHYTQGTVSRAL